MKKLLKLTLLLGLLAVVASILVGCGQENKPKPTPTPTEEPVVVDNAKLLKDGLKKLTVAETLDQDVVLPTTLEGVNDATLTWATSDDKVVTQDGKVTLSLTAKDVTLTATAKLADKTETKEFTVKVLPDLRLYLVEHYKSIVDSKDVLQLNADIELLKEIEGKQVTYTTQNSRVNVETGKVNKLTYAESIANETKGLVNGSFNVVFGNQKTILGFKVGVLPATNEELMDQELAKRTTFSEANDEFLGSSLDLSKRNEITVNGQTLAVTWVSSNHDVLTDKGTLVFNHSDVQTVTLTASATLGDVTRSKVLTFKVQPARLLEDLSTVVEIAKNELKNDSKATVTIRLNNMSLYETVQGGFYLADVKNNLIYAYQTKLPTGLVKGKSFLVVAKLNSYYGTVQLKDVTVSSKTKDTANTITPVEKTYAEIGNMQQPTGTNPMLPVLVKTDETVIVEVDADKYGVFFAEKGTTKETLTAKNGVLLYYQSEIAAARALKGKSSANSTFILQGFRSDKKYFYMFFLNRTGDFTPQLTDQEKVDIAEAQALRDVVRYVYDVTTQNDINLLKSLDGVTITYTSDKATVINNDGQVLLQANPQAQDTVTLSYVATLGTITKNGTIEVKVGEVVENTNTALAHPKGTFVVTQGVYATAELAATSANHLLLPVAGQGDKGFMLRLAKNVTLPAGTVQGSTLKVYGKLDEYKGQLQIVAVKVVLDAAPVVTPMPAAVELTGTTSADVKAFLLAHQSVLVSSGNTLEFSVKRAPTKDKYGNLHTFVTFGTGETAFDIKLVLDTRNKNSKDVVIPQAEALNLQAGDKVTFTGYSVMSNGSHAIIPTQIAKK